MTQEELTTRLLNSMEAQTKKMDQLQEAVRKNNELLGASTSASKELKETVSEANKIFDSVATSVKELYGKVQQIEMFAKLAKQLGPMLGGLGGLGGGPTPGGKK